MLTTFKNKNKNIELSLIQLCQSGINYTFMESLSTLEWKDNGRRKLKYPFLMRVETF